VLFEKIDEMKGFLDKMLPLPEQVKSLQIKVNNFALHQKLEAASPIQTTAK
jgi:hypothetical protein